MLFGLSFATNYAALHDYTRQLQFSREFAIAFPLVLDAVIVVLAVTLLLERALGRRTITIKGRSVTLAPYCGLNHDRPPYGLWLRVHRMKRPLPPTTAVVQVAENGTATLYLGTNLVEHAVGVDPAAVMRVLVDYAATLDTGVRVTTQMPDGTWTRHVVYADGTVTAVPQNMPHARSTAGVGGGTDDPVTQPPTRWARVRAGF